MKYRVKGRKKKCAATDVTNQIRIKLNFTVNTNEIISRVRKLKKGNIYPLSWQQSEFRYAYGIIL